jgi:hypothetical protein
MAGFSRPQNVLYPAWLPLRATEFGSKFGSNRARNVLGSISPVLKRASPTESANCRRPIRTIARPPPGAARHAGIRRAGSAFRRARVQGPAIGRRSPVQRPCRERGSGTPGGSISLKLRVGQGTWPQRARSRLLMGAGRCSTRCEIFPELCSRRTYEI